MKPSRAHLQAGQRQAARSSPSSVLWWHHPKPPHLLEPLAADSSHPYPVELDLHPWPVERDIDLRNWLFGFGAGIRFDIPPALRQEHRRKLAAALEGVCGPLKGRTAFRLRR